MSGQVVYLIWTGEYSGAEVIAAFSEEADADAYVEQHNRRVERWQRARVEIMPLNPVTPDQMAENMTNFHVWLYHDDSNPYVEAHFQEEAMNDIGWGFNVVARDKEHAIKIASERRARLIAEGAGIA